MSLINKKKCTNKKRILFISGGTSGHIEPALAVAKEFAIDFPKWEIEFLGTNSKLENELITPKGFTCHSIAKLPFPRRLNLAALTFGFKFIKAFAKTFVVTSKFDAVIGFGGYVAAPAYLAAIILRKKLFIHEANAQAGLANNLAVKFATVSMMAFPIKSKRWEKCQTVGMPLRKSIIELLDLSPVELAKIRNQYLHNCGLNTDRPTLLVVGGSLGAAKINQIILQSLPELSAAGFNVLHSVGINGEIQTHPNYFATKYFNQMNFAYASADVVLSRSGAVSCAEIMTLKIPALLVPLAIGNGEQFFNAQIVVEKSVAKILLNDELTAHDITNQISWMLQNHKLKQTPNKEYNSKKFLSESEGVHSKSSVEPLEYANKDTGQHRQATRNIVNLMKANLK